MTMIVEHGGTVIPFTDALLRAPKRVARRRALELESPLEETLPDNVIVLAQFARQRRMARRRFRPSSPPDGEAA
jgi:hypothetical protein